MTECRYVTERNTWFLVTAAYTWLKCILSVTLFVICTPQYRHNVMTEAPFILMQSCFAFSFRLNLFSIRSLHVYVATRVTTTFFRPRSREGSYKQVISQIHILKALDAGVPLFLILLFTILTIIAPFRSKTSQANCSLLKLQLLL